MADISENISKIRKAIYGKEVRGSLADGLEAVNKETEAATALSQETEQRQTSLEKQFDEQIANMTLDDPSSAELVAARTNVNTGESYDTIGRRLDAEYADVTAQLAEKASNIRIDSQSINVLYPPVPLVGLKGDYNYETNTGTDDADALQALIDFYHLNGGAELIFPDKHMYLLGKDIDLKQSVRLRGVNWQGSKQDTDLTLNGSVLIIKNANPITIFLHASTAVEDFTIFYPEQKYFIQPDPSKPDGLEDFYEYKTLFVSAVEKGGSFILNNLTPIGCSDFYKQGEDNENNLPMRFVISNIFGFVTRCGIDVRLMYDMSQIYNVHFHGTFYWGIKDLRGVTSKARYTATKLTQTLTSFRFGKVDGVLMENCFTFVCKYFIECYDSGLGGAWINFINCHADVCKDYLRVASSGGLITGSVINATCIVNRHALPLDGEVTVLSGVTDDNEPSSFIHLVGNAGRNKISISSASTFGRLNGQVLDNFCGYAQYIVKVDSQNQNIIQIANDNHRNYKNLVKTNDDSPIVFSNTIGGDGKIINSIISNRLGVDKWMTLPFLNGEKGEIKYRVDKNNIVTITGTVSNFALGRPFAIMPNPGLRPDSFYTCVVSTSDSPLIIARLEISDISGEVTIGQAPDSSIQSKKVNIYAVFRCQYNSYFSNL